MNNNRKQKFPRNSSFQVSNTLKVRYRGANVSFDAGIITGKAWLLCRFGQASEEIEL